MENQFLLSDKRADPTRLHCLRQPVPTGRVGMPPRPGPDGTGQAQVSEANVSGAPFVRR